MRNTNIPSLASLALSLGVMAGCSGSSERVEQLARSQVRPQLRSDGTLREGIDTLRGAFNTACWNLGKDDYTGGLMDAIVMVRNDLFPEHGGPWKCRFYNEPDSGSRPDGVILHGDLPYADLTMDIARLTDPTDVRRDIDIRVRAIQAAGDRFKHVCDGHTKDNYPDPLSPDELTALQREVGIRSRLFGELGLIDTSQWSCHLDGTTEIDTSFAVPSLSAVAPN